MENIFMNCLENLRILNLAEQKKCYLYNNLFSLMAKYLYIKK